MYIRKLALAAMLVGSLVTVPTIAQAQQARQTAVSKLSVRTALVRQGATLSKKNSVRGGSTILFLGGLGAVVGGAALLARGNRRPASP